MGEYGVCAEKYRDREEGGSQKTETGTSEGQHKL